MVTMSGVSMVRPHLHRNLTPSSQHLGIGVGGGGGGGRSGGRGTSG